MTPDLQRLQQTDALGPIIEGLELELVDDPAWPEPSDTSYLSEQDRANPDIAANVDAMAATNKLISWFGRDAEGFVGIWRGPAERALTEAPVVRLDSEGQYSIVAASIPEYIVISVPEDEFQTVREALVGAGFSVGNTPDAIWGALDAFDDDPNVYRNRLYEENRVARGLARSDDPDAADAADADASVGTEVEDESDGVPTDGIPAALVDVARMVAAPMITAANAVGALSGDDDDEDDDDAPASATDDNAEAEEDAGEPVPAKQVVADDEDAEDTEGEADEPAPAKQPARKAAAKKPAAKKPAAKKPAAKKPTAKKPAKAASKPAAGKAKKAAAKKPAPKPAKKAAKKPAPKPAKKAGKKTK